MTSKLLRIATRKSPLAWWQANFVKQILHKHYPSLNIELIGFITAGDKVSPTLSSDFKGKSLFVKELQIALLEEKADIAVHSVKDLSVSPCPGLNLAVICQRDDPRDVLVSKNRILQWQNLPVGAAIGTASPRRQCQLLAKRSDLVVKPIRGNVGTRLARLDQGEFDAIILASAGLKRLQLEERICEYLDPDEFIPAIGQGALGIECREDDQAMHTLLKILDHYDSHQCVKAERAVNYRLGGDCYTPVGAYATIKDQTLTLSAIVGSMNGKIVLRESSQGRVDQAECLGHKLADKLLAKGAQKLLNP